MTTFTMGKITVVCDYVSTRNGFKHTAVLMIGGYEHFQVKCCYQNRTWESYTYESVLHKALDECARMTKRQKTMFKNKYAR